MCGQAGVKGIYQFLKALRQFLGRLLIGPFFHTHRFYCIEARKVLSDDAANVGIWVASRGSDCAHPLCSDPILDMPSDFILRPFRIRISFLG
jgi:hypothetical protein